MRRPWGVVGCLIAVSCGSGTAVESRPHPAAQTTAAATPRSAVQTRAAAPTLEVVRDQFAPCAGVRDGPPGQVRERRGDQEDKRSAEVWGARPGFSAHLSPSGVWSTPSIPVYLPQAPPPSSLIGACEGRRSMG
jgi:hypothetical protein